VQTDTSNQLRHIDFAVSNFFRGMKSDVSELLMHKKILDKDDAGFTNFLNASEDTFVYRIGERESEIIADLNAFRITHAHVNSVYMGRESGAFVRSHPRARPTTYDPRTRPWYILGKENPGQIVLTEPYRSVTSPDVNIGVVKAMTDEKGDVYGVLGADITLVNLTDYIAGFDIGRNGEILLISEKGIILASNNQSLLFTDSKQLLQNQNDLLLSTPEGILILPDEYLIYYTSPLLGWKYAALIPFSAIDKEIQDSIITIIIFVFLSLILLSVITLLILDYTVIRPLTPLTTIAKTITEMGNLNQRLPPGPEGEVGDLTRAFTTMIETIHKQEEIEKQAMEELALYRDNLEKMVLDRTLQLEKVNTDLQEAKERAEAADRLKSAFLATMSHELRTPLNSIIGFTGIIIQGLAGPLTGEQQKQLGMVQHSARHLLALINDVLDISKIEAGELTITREPVDIHESMKSVVHTILPQAQNKGLEVVCNFSPEKVEILGDQRRIEQVIMNLMSNAIKFTEQGAITLSSAINTNNITITVKDTGIGIAPDDINTLFKPFHQIDTGTTRKHEGTGLGLSISKKLIEYHKGTIQIKSEIGKGSEFIVTFPKIKHEGG